jgi:hypothetical protein
MIKENAIEFLELLLKTIEDKNTDVVSFKILGESDYKKDKKDEVITITVNYTK